MEEKHLRTSQLIEFIASGLPDSKVTLKELTDSFSDRAFGIAILIFVLPNIIPHGLPGVSSVTAVPIALFSLQMLLGYHRIKLPKWLAQKPFEGAFLKKVLLKCTPSLRMMEKLIKPRLSQMTSARMERLIGAVILVLAFVIFLPIPFGNFFPSLCMGLLALGLLERDGALVVGGIVAAVTTVGGMSIIILKLLHLAVNSF